MTCAATHGPTVAAMSAAITAVEAGEDALCSNINFCPTTVVRQHGAQAVEDSVLCDVMCCCRAAEGTGARQYCVQGVLDAADALLGHMSRYKAEISYNMTTAPPSPFMHRGGAGLQRSNRWQTRAQQEITGYRPNTGMVRRPDIVVVRDPTQPPVQNNIERVIEMKFRNDPEDREQMLAYDEISGDAGPAQLKRESTCNCNDPNRRRIPVPVPAPARQPVRQPVPAPESPGVWTVIGLGILATAAVLSPFDGPVGDAIAVPAFVGALGIGVATP